jgi:hypothetical protein
MSKISFEEVAQFLKPLVGMTCWHVGAGEGTGSSFHLALGEKVPRRVPLRNASQSDEYGEYQGEASILVWCTWRLDSPLAPITSSDEADKAIARALDILIGHKILEVTVSRPASDLRIDFSDNLQLQVFCDHVPGDPSFDGNWQLRVRETILAAGPGYQWELSQAEAG